MIIGRKTELAKLKQISQSSKAEFIGIYGRRRVGKTFLIREFFKPIAGVQFYAIGIYKGSKADQLKGFKKQLEETFYNGQSIADLHSWDDAFALLTKNIKNHLKSNKIKNILIFLDELPWLVTHKSGFIQALDFYWNTTWKDIPALRLVVCGSAASWMIKNIIHAKGGLHNRLTATLRLLPFQLSEVQSFLENKEIRLPEKQIIEIFMALGGVPYYLDLVKKGYSATQNIGAICFGNGELRSEFDKLFSSLFTDSVNHQRMIQALGKKNTGLTRSQLLEATGLPSGGKFTTWLSELEQAGFIEEFIPYGSVSKNSSFRIIDEYVLFYLKWIRAAPKGIFANFGNNPGGADSGTEYWSLQAQTPAFKTWSGYAFENLCMKHHFKIRAALGFSAVATQVGSWRYAPPPISEKKRSERIASSKQEGAQIDMLFDRADQVITLCEMKYSSAPFIITRAYYNQLQAKLDLFREKTKTTKAIFFVIVAPMGVRENEYSKKIISAVLTMKDLF